MKTFLKKMMSRTKSFSIVDYGVLKACVFFFGLWLATLMPVITTVNPWIYGIVWAALYIYLIRELFKKK